MIHSSGGADVKGQITGGKIWDEITALSHRCERVDFVRRHVELLRQDVVSELTGLVPRLAKADTSKALCVAETALTIAECLRDTESLAQGLRAKGNALHAIGRNRAAIDYHGKALTLFRSINNAEQVARTLSSSIQSLILRGHYDLALAAAKEAKAIFEKQGNQWRVARVELNLGNIYDRQDRIEDALKCYEQAYRYLSLHPEEDPEGVAVALHNMAGSCVKLNQFRRAMTTYQRARQFALTSGMPIVAGHADYNIARLHYLRGDYHRALTILRVARDTCSSSGDEYYVALCHLDLSEIYLEFNMSAEAAEAADQAMVGFKQLGMRYERAKAVVNVAIAMGQGENATRALELFLQARRAFVSEKNRAFPSIIDLYRAVVLVRAGRPIEARKLCVTAMKTFRRLRLRSKAIECHLLLACVYLKSDDLLSAEKHCGQALRRLRSFECPVLNCQANTLMGEIHASAGKESRSYDAYGRARQSLERLRKGIHGDELKIAFMKDRVQIYEALVAYCMKHKRQPKATIEAFEYIEEAKSRSLLDILSTARSASWLGPRADTGHASRISKLREELNWYYHKIELGQLNQASRGEMAALQAELQRRERELLRLTREYSQDDEEGLWWSAALPVDQVRQALPADTIVLEYFQIQDGIVVVLLSQDQLDIVPLAGLSEVTMLLQSLAFQLSKFQIGAEYGRTFAGILLKSIRAHLDSLYRTLIEPIRKRMHARHIVIAPHGVLHDLPFQALFNGQQYLIDEFTISYAPSASTYALCQARSTQRNRKSLVLGIPDQAAPFVQEEVTSIATCLPNAELLLGSDATAERLREKGRQSQFIHIATHGHFRRDSPMFSGIRLGGSYLSLYDLYQLELPAELIALSGCSTGLNVVTAGDELLGLARGLIHAGAETSLLSLWDVQDQSAAQLMTSFYRHLVYGRTKTDALQQAMQQVRLEYPHPYHWAPFILVGKG
jgi:CHAT domain-containing protein/tetratricopeptide (TPR) repeat protein